MEETDHNTRSQENPDKENTGADHDHDIGQGGRSQAAALRSFECTFCKRGFSSAQALGGHMNIHRKDKAKLKHYSSSSFSSSSSHYYSSLEIPKTAPSLAPSIIEHKYRTSTTKWPWSIRYKGSDHKETDVRDRSSTKTHHHHHHHHHLDGEIQLLPLFVDKLSRKDQRRPPRISSVPDGRRDKGFLSLSSSSGLDLELRLGSDPAGESPAGEDFQRFFSI